MRKIIAICVSFLLMLLLVDNTTLSASIFEDINFFNKETTSESIPEADYTIDLSAPVTQPGYTYTDNKITFNTTANDYTYKVVGTTKTNRIVIPSGVDTTIVLSGVDMTNEKAPIQVKTGGTLNLILDEGTTNTILNTLDVCPSSATLTQGIAVEYSSNLIISGSGFLESQGGICGAGIGGTLDTAIGNITITGDAKVEATGGFLGAGIGTGMEGHGDADKENGVITISGNADVVATGGGQAAGIGAGKTYASSSILPEIVITDNANVVATGGDKGAGIGTGYLDYVNGYNSRVEITNIEISGNATVEAYGGQNAAGIGTGATNFDSPEYSSHAYNYVGNILITDNAEVITSGAPGIGAGDCELSYCPGKTGVDFINIQESADVYAISTKDNAPAIGIREDEKNTGQMKLPSVSFSDDSQVVALTKKSTPIVVDEATSTSNLSNIDIVDNTFTEDVNLKVITASGEQIDEFLLPKGYTNVTFKTDEVTNYDAYNLNGDPIGTLIDNNDQPDIPTTTEYKSNVDVHLGAFMSNPPIIIDDETMTVDEGSGTTTGTVTDVVSDPDHSDSELTYTLVDNAQNGNVEFTSGGSYTYTTPAAPDENWNGIDTFTYEVEDPDGNVATGGIGIITVNPINDAPVASGNTYTIAEDEVILDEQLIATDADLVYGDVLTYSISVEPEHGTVSVDPITGLFTYTPTKDYNGTDSFTFEVVDNSGVVASAVINIEIGDLNGGSGQDDAPVAQNETHDLNEDEVYNGTLVATDGDLPYGDTLTYSVKTAPTNGIVTNLDPTTGAYTYTPTQDYVGTDSFTFEVTDSTGLTDTAVITFKVGYENGGTGTNDAPVAEDDNFDTPEDVEFSDSVATNDYDVDINDTLTYTLNENTRGLKNTKTTGTVDLAPDGTFTYIPEANFVGTDTFEYTVTDSEGLTDTATVTIVVGSENGGTGTNDAPVAEDDTFDINEDEVLTDTVISNDYDVDANETLTYSVKPGEEVTHGTLILNTDGTFTYTPEANYVGPDTFTYVVTDSGNLTDEATVTINVGVENGGTGTNDAPVAEDDTFDINEDEVLSDTVISNDYDVDANDTLTYSLVSDVSNGTLVLNNDGTFDYTPDANYVGADTFTYVVTDSGNLTDEATVTINVGVENGGTGTNDAPVANDDSYTIDEDELLADTIASNDVDPDANDTLTYSLEPDVANGTLDLNTDGTFEYTPNANWTGIDTFTYMVTDSEGLTDTAVATINVGENGGTGNNDAPVAEDDTFGTYEDTPINDTVALNDYDVDVNDTLTYSLVSDVAHGTLVLNTDGTFTYTPNANYVGPDTFTYSVSDSEGLTDTAVVTITVGTENGGTGTNDAPIAEDDNFDTPEDVEFSDSVATNDYDVDLNDTLTYSLNEDTRGLKNNKTTGTVDLAPDGTFTYTPEANFVGTDTFEYTVTDSEGLTDTATVTIVVGSENGGTGTNDAPVAIDDTYAINEDVVLSDSVATNDYDVDVNDTLTYSLVNDVTNGTLALNTDGTFDYTPDANYVGEDTFTYEVTDGEFTDEAVVTITVGQENGGTGTNDAPVAEDDTFDINEDQVLSDTVSSNDYDVDANDTLTYSLVSDVSNGTLVLNNDGTFEYTPDANYVGPDTFTYVVTDSGNLTDEATVTINVGVENGGTGTNDAPVAEDDTFDINEDQVLSDTVISNDYDVDANETLSYSVKPGEEVAHGTLVLNTDGTFTYTPEANYVGLDTFTYVVTDSGNLTDEATVTINVGSENGGTGTNDAPVANDDNYAIDEDALLTENVAINDIDPDLNDTLTYSLVSDVSNGTLVLNTDGTFDYTPDTNYVGYDTFTYEVTDGEFTDEAVVTIQVGQENGGTGTNDAPVAYDDSYTIDEDELLADTVASNDVDPDANDTLTYSLESDVANGTLDLNADGTFEYTPNANWTGIDTFTYMVTDSEGLTDTAIVTINVGENGGTGNNDAPVAEDDTFGTYEDTPINDTVALNDYDVDVNDTLTYSLVSDVAHGTLVLNTDGTFTYTPNANYVGPDTFTYSVSDSEGLTDTAVVTITVGTENGGTGTNDAPVAEDDNFDTPEDVEFSDSVATNDYDVDLNDTLTYSLNEDTRGLKNNKTTGTVDLAPDGTFTYTPEVNFVGTDTFEYTVTDSEGLTDTATVTIVVGSENGGTGTNDAPVAIDDTYAINEDVVLSDSVATNDYDVDVNDTLTYSLVNDVTHGTLVLNTDGTFNYTPDANYVGEDTFTYEVTDGEFVDEAVVTITVGQENGGTGTNDAPVAEDDSFDINEDQVLSDTVSSNDYDVDANDILTYSLESDVSNGTLVLNNDGTFDYTPDANYVGVDTFTYVVTDSGNLTDVATVTINVGVENGGTGTNDAPVAEDDTFDINEDEVLTNTVSSNDYDVDANETLSYSVKPGEEVAHGTLVLNADGTFTYTPEANYVGPDTFTYVVTDSGNLTDEATVTINVGSENGGTGTNDAPVANDDNYAIDEDEVLSENVAINDIDPDLNDTLTYSLDTDVTNGALTLAVDGSFTYTPDANWTGTDTFTYTVTDSEGLTDTADVTIEVGNGGTGSNDAPVANDDSYTINEDELLADSVASNDVDPDANDTLTYSLESNVTNGTLTLANDGSFTYVPNTDFNGTDTFTYTVTDSEGLEDTATATINVTGINDAPIVADDNYEIYEETNLFASVAYNDTDAEDASLTYSLDTDVQSGTLSLSANGTFTYTPNKNFTGVDTFTYIATDSEGLTAKGTVTITVNPEIDGPNAVDDVFSTDEDVVLTNSVATNDTDPENGTLTYSLDTDVNSGTLDFASDGTFTYTPDKDFTGVDVFTYTVTDDEGQTDTALVTITINSANDTPDAVDDIYEIDENTNLAGSVAYNDVDAEDSNLTYSLVSDVTNGTLDFKQDGTFTYNPNPGFTGTDTFTYMATDSEGLTDTAIVTITIGEVNEAPNAVDDVFEVKEGTDLNGTVAENDTDDHVLTYSLVTDVAHGTLNLSADGTFTYKPDIGYVGTDTFTYMVTDSEGLTDTATVTIVITDENNAPIAEDDTFTLYNDTTLYSSVAINDVDDGVLTYSLVTDVAHGTLILDDNGSFSYKPDAGYVGTDTFTYMVTDSEGLTDTATVTFVVNEPENE